MGIVRSTKEDLTAACRIAESAKEDIRVAHRTADAMRGHLSDVLKDIPRKDSVKRKLAIMILAGKYTPDVMRSIQQKIRAETKENDDAH